MDSARIAQNILADFSLIDAAVKEDGKEGDVEGENGWRYTITVHPLELQSGEEVPVEIPSMIDLKLCLVHNTGQREKTFELSRWYRR